MYYYPGVSHRPRSEGIYGGRAGSLVPTMEYAIILLAAAAFGGVMAAVLASDAVSDLLLKIVEKALAI